MGIHRARDARGGRLCVFGPHPWPDPEAERASGPDDCVDGRKLVGWRDPEGIRLAPNRCPHLGGPLFAGHREGNFLACP